MERIFAWLNLTLELHRFQPIFSGGTKVTQKRELNDRKRPGDGSYSRQVQTEFGVDRMLKTGASLGLAVANDVLSYYSGKGGYSSMAKTADTHLAALVEINEVATGNRSIDYHRFTLAWILNSQPDGP